jgi:hypothetical protein
MTMMIGRTRRAIFKMRISGGMEIRDGLLEHYPKQQVFSIQQTIQADKQA